MTDDPVRAAQEQITAAIEARRRAYANSPRHRSHWGKELEGQRLPDYRVVVTEQTRHGHRKPHTFVLDPETWDEPGGPHWRWQLHGETDCRPLPAIVPLAQGVDVPARTLVVILEALVSKARHRIDLADVNRIVSQLSPHIARLHTLSEEQRRLAEPALYTQILARCSTM